MTIGPHKPSQAQLRRRRLKVVEHANAGYNAQQSARALGVSPGAVAADRAEMRKYITRPKHARSPRPPAGDPPFYDWVTDPAAVPPLPAYRVSGPVAAAGALLDRLKNENGVSQAAHAAREAIAGNDSAWYLQAQFDLADLIAYLQAMQAVMTDADQRRQAMTLASRDDLATNQRVHSGVKAQHLPEPGTGELPVKVFAELWRRWYAGFPLDAAAAVEISESQNAPLARIEQAIREWLVRFPQEDRRTA
jgi:hypothetical protein